MNNIAKCRIWVLVIAMVTAFLLAPEAEAQITFVNYGTAVKVASGNMASVGVPSGIQNNDILIVVVHTRDNIVSTMPGDWTQKVAGNGNLNNRLTVWWKRTTGTESAPTVSHPVGNSGIAMMFAFRGVVTSGDPFNVAGAVQSNAGSPISTAAITTTVNGAVILHAFGSQDDNIWDPYSGIPTNEARQEANTLGSRNSLGLTYGVQSAAGSTGAAGATQKANGPDAGVSVQMALSPLPPLTPLYRSVGTNGANLNTGLTVQILSTTATFSGSMPNNIGVGDVLTYNSGGNQLAFIHGRTSSTVFTVKDKNGGTPKAAAAGTAVGVYRAYTSLANWQSQTENPNITEPVEDDVNPSMNLVTANTILNVACYADAADTTAVAITGWTTGANNYIKIYTPVSSSEVGISQRHSGKWDTGKYRVEVPGSSGAYAIVILEENVRLDGLQIYVTSVNLDYTKAVNISNITGTTDLRISNCIIRGAGNSSNQGHSGIDVYNLTGTGTVKTWNNVIYDFRAHTDNFGIVSSSCTNITFYLYNNTIYNCSKGFTAWSGTSGTVIAKNNISYSNATYNYDESSGFDSSSTNNLSGPTKTDAPGSNPQNAKTLNFVDTVSPYNLHLASNDTNAIDKGANLSSEFFSDDIDGESRYYGSAWDIGADEYVDGLFGYRRQLTLNCSGRGASCGSSLSNFPVLIDTTNWAAADKNTLRTVSNGGHVYRSDGYDIIFRASDGKTQLDHEIEKYEGSTGTLVAWVRIPTLFDLCMVTGTNIYMYYGNAGITSPTANKTGVWSNNFVEVWHLHETSDNHFDSRNNYVGTVFGNATRGAAGQIDGADQFIGPSTTKYVTLTDGDFGSNAPFTIEAWFRIGTLTQWAGIVTKGRELSHDWVGLWETDTYHLTFGWDGAKGGNVDGSLLTAGPWYYGVGAFDGTNRRLYLNGSLDAVASAGNYAGITGSNTSIANDRLPPNANSFDGIIDEVRISNVARDLCWIQTCYNNQNSPGTFVSPGSEQGAAPTAVKLTSFTATEHSGGVLLKWHTGYEVDNLGFHVYREENGELYRLTPEPVAGSAFLAGKGTALGAGHSYSWWDAGLSPQSSSLSPVRYWLKDIDLNGKHTMHGPVTPILSREPLPEKLRPELLSERGMKVQERYRDYWRIQELKEKLALKRLEVRGPLRSRSTSFEVKASNLKAGGRSSNLKPLRLSPQSSSLDTRMQQFLASVPSVKLFVREEGWYRVTQPELMAAGLDPRVSSRHLQLYTDGKEQPIRVTGKKEGRFGPRDAIEFYGVGLDTPSTDTRVYWLIEGTQPGKRIDNHIFNPPFRNPHSAIRNSFASFPYTVEKKDRTVYFPTFKNGDLENFFGPMIYQSRVDQLLEVWHPDPASPGEALLEVLLLGATTGPHHVKVLFNSDEVGEIVFEGQSLGMLKAEVSHSEIREGENLVSLIPEGGEMDLSLLDSIRLTYWHTYRAEDNRLRFTASGGEHLTLSGFSHPRIRVFDITEPDDSMEVIGKVKLQERGYGISFRAPGHGERTLLAITEEHLKNPEGVVSNHPSSWHQGREDYDLVMITHRDFLNNLQPLKTLRESQGLRVVLIDVEDLYDEFSFGNKSPKAIKDFLTLAKANWRRPPRFVLLVGDASFDPRNYLGYGNLDFVPTKLVETAQLETASDDWFVDLNNDGLPDIAIGRLPVQTVEEAAIVVSKIVGYEKSRRVNEALLVADKSEGSNDFNFEGASEEVRALLPSYLIVRKINRGDFGSDGQAKQELLNGINQGPLLVDYIGHGSVEVWRGNLFSTDDAEGLVNAYRLPFFVSMTCLNGFFQAPYADTMAEALLKAKGGGAVAVWASSGLTEPDKQAVMNKELIKLLFGKESLTLGEATARAKAAVSDQDIRKTWILFGDPTTRLQ